MTQYIGGQALIEGVMMKSKNKVAFAARNHKGDIVVKKINYSSFTEKHKLLQLPIIRGVVFLFEMIVLGVKAMAWSSDQQSENETENLSNKELILTLLLSVGLTVLFFVIIPYLFTKLFFKEVNLTFNLIDGVFRLVVFLAYVVIIGLFSDVKRIFQYHGAEHKAVHCFESKRKLSVKNVQRFSTLHPRCGTSLIIFIIVVSILLFSLIKTNVWYFNLLLRILIVPLIGGVGYELTKLSAKYSENKFLQFLIKPGLWTQKLTTREPDNNQVEVAIKALREAL
ncbi:DUF1385 domain-containing protein [archaeon]|nr:DUF1385 domain-containing protein [archaeon]